MFGGERNRRGAARSLRALVAVAVATVGALSLLAGCAAASAPPAPTATEPVATTPTATPTPTPTPTPDPLEALTLEQRVGQLFIVGTSATHADDATLAAVRDRFVGGVFLHGRSRDGVAATAKLTSRFASPTGIPLWISVDQEGGEVQALRGPGFDDMPYAIRQADAAPADLRAEASTWGAQLRQAGITLNLAPVADIVTSHDARFDNPPIGGLGRQYGYDRATVAAKAGAFADGMRDAGVLPTFKHFPGLGRVHANTDYTAHVVDTVVTADAPDVAVYRDLLSGGPAVVMVGLAVYAKIDDTAPAAFSKRVVTGILRGDVGFDGVVMTDDISATRAVADVAPGERALRALDAGCDVLLVSADAGALPAMYDAVLQRARTDPAFAARVDASVRRVLAAKAEQEALAAR